MTNLRGINHFAAINNCYHANLHKQESAVLTGRWL